MGDVVDGAKVVVEGLKSQPLALALILINVMYLLAAFYMLHTIGERAGERDKLFAQLVAVRDCAPKGYKLQSDDSVKVE